MLALKQGQSLTSSAPTRWLPSDESRCDLWLRKATAQTYASGNVSKWTDVSGGVANDFAQATASEQPEFIGADGSVKFVADSTDNLLSTTQLSLTGVFTIGMRIYIDAVGGVILGDNNTAGEFIKVFSTNKIRIRIDNATAVDLQLDSGVLTGAWANLILTRNSSSVITLHWNGVAQADTETLSGTADIDAIGVRSTDLNPLDASIKEIQIFSATSGPLTARVNTRLSSL